MEVTDTVCPVCTLFLRPGITLKQHLTSHPKQKVIDALVKLSVHEEADKPQGHQENASQVGITQQSPSPFPMPPYLGQPPICSPPNMGPLAAGNHFFMYQQSMSTSSQHQSNVSPIPFNPFTQQYLVPAVYNAQMMPYFYQQQQLIMSSNGIPPANIRALPFEVSTSSQVAKVSEEKEKQPEKDDEEKTHEDQQQQQEVVEERESDCSEYEKAEEIDREKDIDKSSSNDRDSETESVLYKSERDETYKCGQAPQLPESYYVHEENSTDEDYHQSNMLHENDADYETHSPQQEDCQEAAQTSSEWTQSSDLNKACQTLQTTANVSPRSQLQSADNQQSEYFFMNHSDDMSVVFTSENVVPSFEHSDPIYTSANIINNSDGVEFVNMDDIEGMQVIIGDFSNPAVVSQVENYEPIHHENPPILMTISGINVASPSRNQEEHQKHQDSDDIGIGNVNIRSDEKMPARGELSGQESMGSASDLTWNQIHHYQDQENSLYSHNSWDCSSEIPLYIENAEKKDLSTVDVSILKQEEPGYSGESKAKKLKKPLEETKKAPKKLVIKPKRQKKEAQTTTFDSVFTNRLKTESEENKDLDIKEDPSSSIANTEIIEDEIKSEKKLLEPNVCKECDNKEFRTKKELKAHNKEFHKVTRIKLNKCQICHETFTMGHQYNEHLKIHPLECRMCGKLFYRRQGLKLHTARHLGFKPFKCELCDKAFLVKQKLEEHWNCHTGNSPIKCTMCDETFKRHSNLVQHRNKHHFFVKKKVRDYICYCGEIFHSKKKLAWHKETHDPKPKSCTQCTEKFIHRASLTRHMRRAHNAQYLPDDRNPSLVNTLCPICKTVILKSSLEAHLKTHTNQKPYSCTICNKDFTTKWNLKLHRWTHASRTQKPFKCEQCKGAFVRESDYVAHMNAHKSVRPYTCNYCGAQFIRKYNCQRHVKEHENDKTYNCNVCGKSFHRSYYLKDHMRVHSGVRPYACHICGKTSTTKSNHNKHVQIHHAREPVSTES